MFLEPDARGPPPPRIPPRRPKADRRHTNAATAMIILVSVLALGAPAAGARLVAALIAFVIRR